MQKHHLRVVGGAEANAAEITPRRHGLRFNVSKRVDYTFNDRATFAYTWNISAGGLFLRTSTVLPEGTDLELAVVLGDRAEPVVVVGTVTRVPAQGSGIEFVQHGQPQALERIRKFVLDAAERRAKERLEINPYSVSELKKMGDICFERGKYDDAEKYLRQAVDGRQNNYEAQGSLAETLLVRANATGDTALYEQAQALFDSAIEQGGLTYFYGNSTLCHEALGHQPAESVRAEPPEPQPEPEAEPESEVLAEPAPPAAEIGARQQDRDQIRELEDQLASLKAAYEVREKDVQAHMAAIEAERQTLREVRLELQQAKDLADASSESLEKTRAERAAADDEHQRVVLSWRRTEAALLEARKSLERQQRQLDEVTAELKEAQRAVAEMDSEEQAQLDERAAERLAKELDEAVTTTELPPSIDGDDVTLDRLSDATAPDVIPLMRAAPARGASWMMVWVVSVAAAIVSAGAGVALSPLLTTPDPMPDLAPTDAAAQPEAEPIADSGTYSEPPPAHAPIADKLLRKDIVEGVKNQLGLLESCVTQARRMGTLRRGTHTFVVNWTIQPSGEVTDVVLVGPKMALRGKLGRCFADILSTSWEFSASRTSTRIKRFPVGPMWAP